MFLSFPAMIRGFQKSLGLRKPRADRRLKSKLRTGPGSAWRCPGGSLAREGLGQGPSRPPVSQPRDAERIAATIAVGRGGFSAGFCRLPHRKLQRKRQRSKKPQPRCGWEHGRFDAQDVNNGIASSLSWTKGNFLQMQLAAPLRGGISGAPCRMASAARSRWWSRGTGVRHSGSHFIERAWSRFLPRLMRPLRIWITVS